RRARRPGGGLPVSTGGRTIRVRATERLAALADACDPGTRRGRLLATLVMAVLCALLSLLRGQDANWDLRNYHLHNAWSWLHGRFALDLAPAQLQSYFIPLLDLQIGRASCRESGRS